MRIASASGSRSREEVARVTKIRVPQVPSSSTVADGPSSPRHQPRSPCSLAPFAVFLNIFHSIVFVFLPCRISVPIGAATGMTNRLIARPPIPGNLDVYNHRTLLDQVYISASLNRVVVAATYAVSAVSEAILIKTARLTRNKEDQRKLERLRRRGYLAVVVRRLEGTTCREPFLLRFSPLLPELADELIPLALATRVSISYGTTASGFKVLDSFYFLENPWPEYDVEFLEKTEMRGDGSRYDVVNRVQREIASALGFSALRSHQNTDELRF